MPLRKANTDLLIIVPPARSKFTVYPPYGAMYIASALRGNGCTTSILNVDIERMGNPEVIQRIKDINPKYIGFSGIVSTSYKYIKDLSLQIKSVFPEKIQILGGGLSSAPEPVLNHTAIDIVVQGEGDITIVELINCLESGNGLNNVPGIVFREGSSNIYTEKRALIKKLDSLPYPAFDLVDMDKYLPDGIEFIHSFTTKVDKKIYDPARKRKMITIPTSRGCFGECSFCFRAYKGLRVNSINYVLDFIEYCIERFDVGFFTFGDECFAPNTKRNWDFIEEYRRRGLDIVFRILGMRVDTVDKDILQAYKEIGCWMIEYGFESGSQKMLNIIDKRVSVEQNRQVAIWTNEAGIYTSPTLVLGMPGETNETIGESIEFIKSLNFGFRQYQMTYALPIPGSPLYNFSKMVGAIKDEDEYLSFLAGERGLASNFHVNLTDEPDEVVAQWTGKIARALDQYYLSKYFKSKWLIKIVLPLYKAYAAHKKKNLWGILKKKFTGMLNLGSTAKGEKTQRLSAPFRKPAAVIVEDFFRNSDLSRVNSELSLKHIIKNFSGDQNRTQGDKDKCKPSESL